MTASNREPGVCSGHGAVRAVLDRDQAADYLDVEPTEFWELRRTAGIPRVQVPRTRHESLVRVADLDRYLAKETDGRWLPYDRFGNRRVLGTWRAGTYLHLTSHQVRRLARLDELPHEGGGRGIAYRFRVGELDRCLDRWASS